MQSADAVVQRLLSDSQLQQQQEQEREGGSVYIAKHDRLFLQASSGDVSHDNKDARSSSSRHQSTTVGTHYVPELTTATPAVSMYSAILAEKAQVTTLAMQKLQQTEQQVLGNI